MRPFKDKKFASWTDEMKQSTIETFYHATASYTKDDANLPERACELAAVYLEKIKDKYPEQAKTTAAVFGLENTFVK